MAAHNDLGAWGEQKASEYLEQQGYTILHRNWKAPKSRHELDIVAIGERRVVIIEVKTRSANSLTNAIEAVDGRKIHDVACAADSYVKINRIDLPIRFDVIAIDGDKLEHIKNAFYPPVRYYR